MLKRKIITIHEEKCNGCGKCVTACHEGAIELVDGVAKLVSDIYCDGLGDCLPECPTGAIEMIEREAEEYDDDAVQRRMAERVSASSHTESGGHAGSHSHQGHGGHAQHADAGNHSQQGHGHAPHSGCPGSMSRLIQREEADTRTQDKPVPAAVISHRPSELAQWPIQLHLVNPANSYFDDADLLIAADCTAFAYGDFHKDFMKGRITMIGCPKLDDTTYYTKKLVEILSLHTIRSITVVRMGVPCCGGILTAVKQAMLAAVTIVPYQEITININGEICS
jgi:ferredoxin